MPDITLVENANRQKKLMEALEAFGHQLSRLASERAGQRIQLETRWVQDLAQYRGEEDPQTQARLAQRRGRSQVVVNITRNKCNAAEARLSEMLFPTDDRNWSLEPTPVPRGMESPLDVAEAREKARVMQREIDDQLLEAGYAQAARQVIHDGVVFGTGIIKAPIILSRVRKAWEKVGDENRTLHVLKLVEDLRPGVERVPVWDFFPDLSAASIEDAEDVLERKYLTKSQVRELFRYPGYIEQSLRKVLAMEPRGSSPASHTATLRALSSLSVNLDDNRYERWEYHGPVPVEVLEAAGAKVPEKDRDMAEMEGIVVFIGPHIIKAAINPMETGDRPYSVFVYEPDDLSIFGFGIPSLLRHNQRIINSAWRTMMENAGLSSGPQIVVNRHLIQPADGSWDLRARKVWYVTDPSTPPNAAFASFSINSHQNELMNIYQIARQMADDETNLPPLAQGALSGAPPETASALSMLLNSANSVLKRIVRRFDDGITLPVIRRFYDYNMAYNENEGIKGDYEVKARGSTALLVKESQLQAMQGVLQLAMSPVFGPITRLPALYRKALQLVHFNSDDVVLSDDEIEQMQAQQAQGQGTPSREEVMLQTTQMKLQFEQQRHQDLMADREANRRLKTQIAQLERETEMMRLAQQANISLEKIKAQLGDTALRESNRRELQAEEIRLKQETGEGI